MKNTNSTATSNGGGSSSGSARSFFFSNWTAPQNPIITLLKKRRESKMQSQPEKVTSVATMKTNNEATTTTGTLFGKVTQQHRDHHQQRHQLQQQQLHQQQQQLQQQQLHHHQQQQQQHQHYQTSVNTSTHMNGTNYGAKDFFEKRVTTGFQPMKIEEYEPGHSSIAKREGIVEHSDYNPPICKPGELCHYTESSQSKNFRIRKKDEDKNSSPAGFSNGGIYRTSTSSSSTTKTANSVASKTQTDHHVEGANVYKKVLMGGPIPEEGLRNLVEPRRVKTLPPMTSPSTATSTLTKSYSGLPANGVNLEESFERGVAMRSEMVRKKTREELEEEAQIRRRTVEKMIIAEKLKKLEEERKLNEARRHSDNFLPIEKSPVRLNRYDDENETVASGKTQAKFTATAMYNFKAKNDRELSFRKGNVLFVRRQVDKNWFEGERNGLVGIFPITYVKIRLPSTGSNKKEPMTRGIALYDFTAHKPPELSLYKGDRVTIVGMIDENWVEGRSRNGEGIFPVNFVQLIDDDDLSQCSSTYGTPLPSRVATPSLEQKNIFPQHIQKEIKLASRVASPVGSITSSYAPSIPSAPLSPYGSQDFDPQNSNFISNWPNLEASLLNLEKAYVTQMTNQQQLKNFKQQKFAARNQQSQQQQQNWQSDSQYSTLQHYKQELRDSEQHLHQLQQKYQQQPLQRQQRNHLNYGVDRSFSPHPDLFTRSAHPDLYGSPASPIRVASLTRSVTNPAFSESSRSFYSRSPSNRYPSLISKDPVAIQRGTIIRDKMSKQNEAITKEFLSRHGSTSSFSGESMSTIRENIPTSRYSMPVARDSFPISRDYTIKAKDSERDDMFSFKEIKLVPRLPVDYSKQAYSVETRTSLPGSHSKHMESESNCNSQSTSRMATPTKNYEWFKVMHDYEPRKPDELRLAKGDLIQVGEKCKDGWWVGISQSTGRLGLFPGNYVIST